MIDLGGARAKHHRARELLSELLALTDEYLEHCGENLIHEVLDGGRTHEWRMGEAPALGVRWALLAGDVAHNARVSLDHAVRALIVASGGEPGVQEFPVVSRPLDPSDRRVRGLSPVALEAIESEQPYRRHALPLQVVHELDRIDKHRVLLPAITAVDVASWSMPAVDVTERVFNHGPIEADALVARFVFGEPVEQVHLGVTFAIRLSQSIDAETKLDAGELRKGDPAHWGLKVGVHYVGRILDRLEALTL